ncbi:MAG: LysE family transporter [Paracoccaceae bacterium]
MACARCAARWPGGTGAQRPARAVSRPYLTGLAVVLSNPKAAMMWVAISVYLAGIGIAGLAVLPVGGAVAGSALLVYGGYGWIFSSGPVSGAYARFARWIEGAFGAVFALIGGRLALDGLRALR